MKTGRYLKILLVVCLTLALVLSSMTICFADGGVLSLSALSAVGVPAGVGYALVLALVGAGVYLTSEYIIPVVREMYVNHLQQYSEIRDIQVVNNSVALTDSQAELINDAISYYYDSGFTFNTDAVLKVMPYEFNLTYMEKTSLAERPSSSATLSDYAGYPYYYVNSIPNCRMYLFTNDLNKNIFVHLVSELTGYVVGIWSGSYGNNVAYGLQLTTGFTGALTFKAQFSEGGSYSNMTNNLNTINTNTLATIGVAPAGTVSQTVTPTIVGGTPTVLTGQDVFTGAGGLSYDSDDNEIVGIPSTGLSLGTDVVTGAPADDPSIPDTNIGTTIGNAIRTWWDSTALSQTFSNIADGVSDIVTSIKGFPIGEFATDILSFLTGYTLFQGLLTGYLPVPVATFLWAAWLTIMALWIFRMLLNR